MKVKGFSIYHRLLHYASKYWSAFALGIVGTALTSGIDASFAWLIKPLLDKGFIARDNTFIHWLPLGLIAIFLLRNLASVAATYGMSWTGRAVVAQFRQDLFAHYIYLPAHYLDSTTAGQLLAKLIYNTEQVAKASTDAIVTIVRESFFIIGLLIVMFINSWQLSISFIIAAPIVGLISRFASRRMRRLSQSIQKLISHITQLTEEGLTGYRVIRTFGAESYEISRFNTITKQNWQREMKIVATNALSTAGVQLVAGLLIAGTVYLATAKTMSITAGTFVSIISAMLAMLKPMRNLTNVNNSIQKGIAGAESLFEILDQPLEIDQGQKILTQVQGAITFDAVAFTYRNTQKMALAAINLQVLPGQMVALVGRSGSGKSTLMNLLLRFYNDYLGTIQLDGEDIRHLSLKNLRQHFALVSQQVVLFNDTIARNIAYGQNTIAPSQIIAAAEAAHAMEFIQQLPQGLDTIVGDNGVLLSGGQRQRLAIARAILKNAPILILDEATSALDSESEQYIQTALAALMHNRTTLVIAHRLSTIEKADQIIVMDQGRIIESGTHTDLLMANSYYQRLHARQFKV